MPALAHCVCYNPPKTDADPTPKLLAAIVTHVHDDETVSLFVFEPNAVPRHVDDVAADRISAP